MAALGVRITKLDINERALARVVNRSPQLRAELRRRLLNGLRNAKRIAPDETPIGQGYVAGLGWVILEQNGEVRGYLFSRDFKTFWVEYGTKASEQHKATPAYRVLSKSLDALR